MAVAASGWHTAAYGPYAQIQMRAIEYGVNNSTNVSRVRLEARIYYPGGRSTSNQFPQTLTMSITGHGEVYTNTGITYSLSTSSRYSSVYTGYSTDIAHDNASGSKTVKVNLWITDGQGDSGGINFNYALTTIPRKPSTPTISSITSVTDSSGKANWSRGGIAINQIAWRTRNGSWQYINTTATSGSFSIGGLSPGTYYNIDMQTKSSASGLWSSTASRGMTTLNRSSVSNFKVSAKYGTYNQLVMDYTSSQSGGSTTVQYKIDNGAWTTMPSNKTLTGLGEGVGYTVYARALNSSGVYSAQTSAWVRTHSRPSGTVSLTQPNRTTFRVASSGLANTTTTNYKIGSGSWVLFNGSATFSVTPTTNYSVTMEMYSSTTGLYSTVTTSRWSNGISSLSSISLKPKMGTYDQVDVSYNQTQTGGTTSVQYNIDNGVWIAVPSSKVLSGLAEGRNYAFRLRAVNNSGEINEYGPYYVAPYQRPAGELVLSQTNKISMTIQSRSLARHEGTRYQIDAGPWIEFTDSATVSVNPGQTYSVGMQIYNNSNGLTTTTSRRSISIDALAQVQSLTRTDDLRNKASFNLVISNGPISGFEWRLGSGAWSRVTTTQMGHELIVTNLVSNTEYTLSVRALDSQSKRNGPERKTTFTTATFVGPVATYQRLLTGIKATYTFRDSGKMLSNVDNVSFNPKVYQTGEVLEILYTRNGSMTQDTSYLISAIFKDEYGPLQRSVSSSERTLQIPLPFVDIRVNPTIKSLELVKDRPEIRMTFPTGDYERTIVFTLSTTPEVHTRTVVMTEGNTNRTTTLTYNDLINLVKGTVTNISSIKGVVSYKEEGRLSPSQHEFTVNLPLENSLLKMPLSNNITLDYTAVGDVLLNELLDHSINQVIVKTPQILGLLGSDITKITYNFNNENKIASTQTGSGTVVTFGSYKDSVSNTTVTITAQDSRGLVNSVSKQVVYRDYKPPVLEVRGMERVGGFGKKVVAIGTNISYFKPRVKVGSQPNKIKAINVNYYVGGSDVQHYFGQLLDPTTIVDNAYIAEIELVADSPSAQKLFLENQGYRITLSMTDSFYERSGVLSFVDEIIIPTGKPLLFIDKENSQVGIGTTNPYGALHVEGDTYTTKIFSMNGIFFRDSDVEDI